MSLRTTRPTMRIKKDMYGSRPISPTLSFNPLERACSALHTMLYPLRDTQEDIQPHIEF
jgi:hypothetical protein